VKLDLNHPRLGVAAAVFIASVAPLALDGCGFQERDLAVAPTLTEYSEPVPGPSTEGPMAILRAALQPLPDSVQFDPEKAALGRRLFHDPSLSIDGTLSCASCHSLDQGGADARRVSIGVHNQLGPINSPTVLNARYNFRQFWDGRAADLREQASGPMANPLEMGNTLENAVATIGRSEDYVARFRALYADGLTLNNLVDAIAVYEETLVTPSRVDRFLKGDIHALNQDELAGAELFVTQGCISCHQGVNVGGSSFQKVGTVRNYFADRGNPTVADNGRYNVTHNEADRFMFKVPTLRNVALTAPYFHDASQATLDDAVRTMARYQLGRDLDNAQVAHLVAFLRALTGEIPTSARLPANEVPQPIQGVLPATAVPGVPAVVTGAPRPAGAAAPTAAPRPTAPAAAPPHP
jgi:cytochrome c peroxidase